jgi:hypothetical protein
MVVPIRLIELQDQIPLLRSLDIHSTHPYPVQNDTQVF